MSIFISLNWKDIHDAGLLEQTLIKWGFAGGWTMESIPGGQAWQKDMLEALNESSICLLSVSKNGVTFTQGYETGVAFNRGLRVIPVLHSSGGVQTLPSVLESLQCRLIEKLNSDRSVLKSRLIHHLHPYFVAPATCQWVIELVELIVKARNDNSAPRPRRTINCNTQCTVAKATKRQQLAGMLHLTKHGDSANFLDSFKERNLSGLASESRLTRNSWLAGGQSNRRKLGRLRPSSRFEGSSVLRTNLIIDIK